MDEKGISRENLIHREDELHNGPIDGEKYSPLVLFQYVDSLMDLAQRPRDYQQVLKVLIGNNSVIRNKISEIIDSNIGKNHKKVLLEVLLADLRDI